LLLAWQDVSFRHMKARTQTAFLFDLDGTLIDSVYDHVMAWAHALQVVGLNVSLWRIHRRIGMSGGLFSKALEREIGTPIDDAMQTRLRALHAEHYNAHSPQTRVLPGARELLAHLTDHGIPWAIATSGRMETAGPVLKILGVDVAKQVVITRDMVRYAKPDPDLFLAAAEKLGVDVRSSCIVGDSIWDMLAAQRAGGLGIGLLSGGYDTNELERAGAYRVYEDPADMLDHIDEIGGRR
jgi:HAD superfamily hydrolase (TIGR01509 family)